ncbi:SpaH/EbpB family LPXTG-anchored major pilin [uncultured Ruminococcus sp.]|uniref:SpaH/EbpB family LPXTG-anchored major pilin n=1 Tax=uncultured Ruminococcus sp. TaxID=165186 RepID=UPI00292DB6F4|nr:SpaH/EbpB family LPXTG-anchored major pilin [uncultured Ruminococcus sp.]
MKATKRILAVVMAVMMLALMVPFAASAADTYTATIKAKEGYTISMYKLAAYDGTSDHYTAVAGVADGIKTAVEAKPVVAQTVLTAAETAKKAGQNTGTQVGTAQKAGTDGKVTFTTTEPGLYYATVTGTPVGVNVKSTGGAVFYLSDAKDGNNKSMTTAEVNISSKISDGDVTVSKKILSSDMGNDYQATAKIGEEVKFQLTASVTGTKDEYLNSYVIHDSMAEGLDFVKVDSVVVDFAADEDATLTETDDYTVTSTNKSDIQIALTADYLNDAKAGTNRFYDAANVTVTLVGKLNDNAVVGRKNSDDATLYDNIVANYNKDSLSYKNKYNAESTKNGNTVHVYTFSLPVEKVDATNNNKITDEAATFLLTGTKYSKSSDTVNGVVTFSGLKAGTYTLKETAAPKGYNINNTEYTVVIASDGTITMGNDTITKVTVGDTPIIVPATGGQGTMIFTIIGASLIACAGIFFIIFKRRTSK